MKKNRRSYWFIYDVGPQSRLEWLASAFTGEKVAWLQMHYHEKNRIYRWRKPLHFLGYLELACRSVIKSKPGDCLISWNFIIGAFIGILCRLFRLERTVLSLNMISHAKQGIVARIRKQAYNYAFAYKGFYFTVNAHETLLTYCKEYTIETDKVTVLPDAFLSVYKEKPFESTDSYIFSGGEAQRDWPTFFKAATLLPEYAFMGVARKKYFPKGLHIPANVEMRYDIKEPDFNRLLEQASIVALPLLSDKPAGLIVILKSVFLSKPLIVTRTPPVENYLQHEESALLLPIGDAKGLVEAITRIRNNQQEAQERTIQARKRIEQYSPERYSQSLYQAVQASIASRCLCRW